MAYNVLRWNLYGYSIKHQGGNGAVLEQMFCNLLKLGWYQSELDSCKLRC